MVAEVHNTRGERHAYLLPPADDPALVTKALYASPFHPVDGHYLVRAPRPEDRLDVTVSLHRGNQPAFVATLRGNRLRASVPTLLRLQLVAPLAPLRARLDMRVQAAALWLRGVRRVPWRPLSPAPARVPSPVRCVEVTFLRDRSVAS